MPALSLSLERRLVPRMSSQTEQPHKTVGRFLVARTVLGEDGGPIKEYFRFT